MNRTLTREELLRRGLAGGAILAFPGIFADLAAAEADAKKTLTISNWPLYIDKKGSRHPSLDLFTKRTGVKVRYIEDVNDNAGYFGKIQAPLARGESIGRDIIILTDSSPYPALLVQKGWLEKLDKKAIPNLKNLQESERHPAWDPNRDYSLPWQTGMTGIGYNAKGRKPITSIEQLFTDKSLHGKVTCLSEFSDAIGFGMLANGDDPEKVTDAAFSKALKRVEKAFKSGQIRQFTGNDYADKLAKGDIVAAVAYSGDMVQLLADNPHFRFQIPAEGGMVWTDNMMVPKHGDAHTASVFMNFVYDPKIAAQIEDSVNYICPVKGADKALLKSDPAVAKNTLVFPTTKMRSQLHRMDPKALFNGDFKKQWQKVLGA
jgi:spermidine/putrescine transport system substrate-binding protein